MNNHRARDIVLKHGWNTTCFQILNPGIELWFSAGCEAVVGYVRKAGVRVVAGAPVCALEDLRSVVEEWERAERSPVCYFGAEGRMRDAVAERPGYSTVSMGAQPVWSPATLVEQFEADRSLRAQRARARNKGVSVNEWEAEKANHHPALRNVLAEWLETRGLPPMHFLVEPETLGSLEGRRVFVASLADEPVGFLVLSPSPARRGWLTEQFVRGAKAPNGTVEYMMIAAARAVEAEGDELITMGIVPLATRGGSEQNPVWLEIVMRWARAHGRRFYNFEGLEWFKDKFHPDSWEPIYAIANEPRFSFRMLYAVIAAFTQVPPPVALMRGISRAAGQEIRWLTRKKAE